MQKHDHLKIQSIFAAALKRQGIDAALISAGVNQLWLTGALFSGYFYITAEGAALLFLKKPNVTVKDGIEIRKPELIPDILKQHGLEMPSSVMLEDDYLPAIEYARLRALFPEASVAGDICRSVRAVKTDAELEVFRASAVRHTELYAKIPGLFKQGMTDLELSAAIEHQARLMGHLGIMRMFGTNMEIHMGSVLTGDNAAAPSPYDFAMGGAGMSEMLPIGPNGTRISQGSTVMVDMSGNFYGYMTDMTRTYANGAIPQIAQDLHKLSLEIQAETAERALPGASCAELYDAAETAVRKHSSWEHYMGYFQGTKFLGHGTGLEINELPVIFKGSKAVLEENMVIALEPKFVMPGIGPVGTENTYIIGKRGAEKITLAPEEIIDLTEV